MTPIHAMAIEYQSEAAPNVASCSASISPTSKLAAICDDLRRISIDCREMLDGPAVLLLPISWDG